MSAHQPFPQLPLARPDPRYSLLGQAVSARETVHATLCGSAAYSSSSTMREMAAGPSYSRGGLYVAGANGETDTSEASTALFSRRQARTRAKHRALRGLRPAGGAVGCDAQDLSDDEAALELEKEDLNHFGHRFLIPIGRRNTQMEAEAAPSPSPSDHDQRQEDRQGVSPSPIPEDNGLIDLDASLEDRDATDEPYELDAPNHTHDGSTEYDSDDLALMREMDRSIGSDSIESSDMDDN